MSWHPGNPPICLHDTGRTVALCTAGHQYIPGSRTADSGMGAQAGLGPGRNHVKMTMEGEFVCMCVYTCVCVRACTRVCVCMHAHTCVRACVCLHVHVCACVGADGDSIHSSIEWSDGSCRMGLWPGLRPATPEDYPKLRSPPATGVGAAPPPLSALVLSQRSTPDSGGFTVLVPFVHHRRVTLVSHPSPAQSC